MHTLSKYMLLLLIFAVLPQKLIAQDTDFWFVAPQFSNQTVAGYPLDRPAFLALSNMTAQTAHVTITLYNGGTPIVTPVNIAPYGFYKMDFNANIATIQNPRSQAGNVATFGTHISSDAKISAYFMANHTDSRDIFTLKGNRALGTLFYVPMQHDNHHTTGTYTNALDQIDIVATADGTTVTVTPKAIIRIGASGTSPAGAVITRTLNKGQTLKIMENTPNSNPSLAGTKIEATKPVAVTVSEDLISGDTSGDQIVPVNSLGKRYVVVKGFSTTANAERLYMVGTEATTTVKVYTNPTNSSVYTTYTLNAGTCNVYAFPTGVNAVYVEADKPIYCYQLAGANEFGAALLPSMYAIAQNRVSYYQVPAQSNSAFIVFRTGTQAGFTAVSNGTTYPLSVTPSDIPGTADWKYARITLPTVSNQVVTISNPNSIFAFGYIGSNTTINNMTFYGYLTAFGSFSFASDTLYKCDGSPLALDGGYALSYDWLLPNGAHLNTSSIQAADTGKYTLTLNQDPAVITASVTVLNRFQGSSISVAGGNNTGAGTYAYTANHGLYTTDNVSYTWLVDGVQAGTGALYTATYNNTDEKLITLHIRDTIMGCTKIHTLAHHKMPENISDASCITDPPEQEWSIDTTATSVGNLSPYQSVVTGDIDGDGIVEIICAANPTDGTVTIGGVSYSRPATHIAIYKGNNIHQPPKLFQTTKPFCWNYKLKYAIVKTKINSNDTVLIVVAEADRFLRAYNYNGALVWTSNIVYHASQNDGVSPVFADVNHDGIPEIAIAGSLFNSVNGQRICTIPTGYPYNTIWTQTAQLVDIFNDGKVKYIIGDHIYSINLGASNNITSMTLDRVVSLPPSFNALIDHDHVPLTTHRIVNALFADMDNDGRLEMIVVHSYEKPTDSTAVLYIADPATGNILAAKYIPDATDVGYPFVGDVDGDGKPDISLIKGVMGGAEASYKILSYKYTPGNSLLSLRWELAHTDASCVTGLTLFDFDQDGLAELVYRDETHIRIIDGTDDGTNNYTNRNKAIFNNYSGTSAEYPVVADVDGDGQAEIIIVGGKTSAGRIAGDLWIFKSHDPVASPWAPARKVWNQYTYHPAYVNADLSIPKYPIYPAAKFPGTDKILGTDDDVQPYNNFLQQQTMLNIYGTPLWTLPDAKYENVPKYDYYPDGDSLNIIIDLINTGDAPLQSPFYISVYKKTTTETFLTTDSIIQLIPVNTPVQKTINIKNLSNYLPFDSLIIYLNDKNQGKYLQLECDTIHNRIGEIRAKITRLNPDLATVQKYYSVDIPVLNNDSLPTSLFSGAFNLKDSVIAPPKAGTLEGVGSAASSKLIYTNNGNPLQNNIDSFQYNFTFRSPELSAYRTYSAWVYIYILDDHNGAATCYGQPHTVNLALKPENVTFKWWNTSGTALTPPDGNSRTVTGITADAAFQIQPDVHLQQYNRLGGFPKGDFTIKLANTSGTVTTMRWTGLADTLWQNPANWVAIKTDGNGMPYQAPVSYAPTTCVDVLIPSDAIRFPELTDSAYCNNIKMENRAMLKNPHVLNYDSASVEIKLKPSERDRFIMWSAPLKAMYSGDYHFKKGSDPQWGDVSVNLFQQQNPAGGTTAPLTFTATFGKLDKALPLGTPFNLKVTTTSESKDKLLVFPQKATSYTDNATPPHTYSPLARDSSARFITDDKHPVGANGTFPMPVVDNANMTLVQVVNPYLAYLDFTHFHAGNSTAITNGYYIWDGDINSGFTAITASSGNRYTISSAPAAFSITSPNLIPPLQSFVVLKQATGNISTLNMSPSWTTTNGPSYTLRSTQVLKGGILRIKATQGLRTSYAVLAYELDASPGFGKEDMPVVTYDEIPLTLYSYTSGREPLSINISSNFASQNTDLGLRILQPGEVKLSFEELETFGHDVVLIDKQLGNKEVNLKTTPEYPFTVTKAGELNDRFSLRMQYTGQGIVTGSESATPIPTIQVSSQSGYLNVQTVANVISNLQVYSLTGTLLYSSSAPADHYSIPLSGGVYIVKALIGATYYTEKAILK